MDDDPVPLLHDYLVHSARSRGEKVGLVCDGHRVTYGQLEAWSNALAHHLAEAGVERGDRVMIFADNTVEAVVSFWAVLKANAVVCLINPLTKRDKLSYLLDDCQPTALITQKRLYATFNEPARHCSSLRRVIVSGTIDDADLTALPHAVRWNATMATEHNAPPARRCIDIDLAAIVYTSGSTGEPKGVMLTHRNMMAACASVASYLSVRDDEVILNVLPLAFDYGLYQMIMAVRAGARLVLERSFAFPAQVLRRIAEEKITGFPGVPTIFSTLLQLESLTTYDLSSIRYVTSTGAALPVQHLLLLKAVFSGARIYSMYGLTECKRCTYLPPEDLDRKPTSVGIAIPNTEMWIVDERGQRLGPGVAGQLVIRGATVMKGYWRKPDATARKLKPGPLPGEQVLYTGDYCQMDAEGYLYFISRSDEVIKSRGEKVAPKEVESALLDIPGVREAAVVGVPDEVLGHAIKAFVVVDQGRAFDEKQIQRECQERLESFMVPKYIVIVPDLPRTDTGKISKRELIAS
ncbi:AMP-dependent synthetase [Bradyrhizobium centrolobii]|uniref:3-methylmercaptopropionyl-CoA ligase n=1 Tax=Bradyrhizobium centrolobii TaxID=1505087 RepID=A0A176YSL0_9BRAD|nr:class I adenylate-forming enzyme family protein [Bradyrhizobium centrolobii]OAF10682.1 AMP-dependent synthetase [Bradyrhizobium centrolobii]